MSIYQVRYMGFLPSQVFKLYCWVLCWWDTRFHFCLMLMVRVVGAPLWILRDAGTVCKPLIRPPWIVFAHLSDCCMRTGRYWCDAPSLSKDGRSLQGVANGSLISLRGVSRGNYISVMWCLSRRRAAPRRKNHQH